VIARLLGKPHIVIEHSGALHLLRRVRGGRILARIIVSNAHRVIVVSNDLRSKLLELCPDSADKIDVIRMGVDAASPESIESPRDVVAFGKRVLFLGRLTQIKGVDVLIRATARVEGLTLFIAGDGPDREKLEKLARELSVQAVFVGRVNALERRSLFAQCRVVVIPSREMPNGRTEGTPVVCLEAMAAGCVVIASASGGLAEIVQDGHNGLLFEPEDHEQLARKLKSVLSSGDLSERLADHAVAAARAFDSPLTTLRFEKIIEAALRRDESIHRNHRIDIRSSVG
jgi:glycosyltransferase involved in cell wall biosynthesis